MNYPRLSRALALLLAIGLPTAGLSQEQRPVQPPHRTDLGFLEVGRVLLHRCSPKDRHPVAI